jgi:hypothetical protein
VLRGSTANFLDNGQGLHFVAVLTTLTSSQHFWRTGAKRAAHMASAAMFSAQRIVWLILLLLAPKQAFAAVLSDIQAVAPPPAPWSTTLARVFAFLVPDKLQYILYLCQYRQTAV